MGSPHRDDGDGPITRVAFIETAEGIEFVDLIEQPERQPPGVTSLDLDWDEGDGLSSANTKWIPHS